MKTNKQKKCHAEISQLIPIECIGHQSFAFSRKDLIDYICTFLFQFFNSFCLPPGANVIYQDATRAEVDAEIFFDIVRQGMFLAVFPDDGWDSIQVFPSILHYIQFYHHCVQEFSNSSSASHICDSGCSESSSTLIMADKRLRVVDDALAGQKQA